LGAARTAWQQYLAVDRDSEWAGEAGTHLAALDSPLGERSAREVAKILLQTVGDVEKIVRRRPQLAREAAERHLLGAWARFTLHGNRPAAEQALAVARKVGLALAQGGEQMVLDSVKTIAAAEGAPERLHALAEG